LDLEAEEETMSGVERMVTTIVLNDDTTSEHLKTCLDVFELKCDNSITWHKMLIYNLIQSIEKKSNMENILEKLVILTKYGFKNNCRAANALETILNPEL
jgi:hypothetical protein